ncbi:OmpA family protein [Vibrio sp. ZSDE26]|uniref:OmpA family protein n=1 Tax=Vibrio amylolyticus TaxID=2847292 RepID=A0A9X2BH82_9VIBR|nr:OmpA family protein [Vibrio amylolyticus]MCK6263706.1 OmpA family protein [Vibrio amylolyticus]
MKKNKTLAFVLSAVTFASLVGCSSDTYVSKENMDKFGDPQVEKFLIRECIVPERDIRIAIAEHFDFDKAELKEQDHASIDQLISSIKHLHGQIAIVAHTDYQGSSEYNEKLSIRRAESVKAYMETQLDGTRYDWELKHYGENKPIAEGKTLEANAQNRRAYIVFEQTQTQAENAFCAPPEPERKVFVAMTSHFDFDKYELKESDKTSLDEFVSNLTGLNGRILVAGHTDAQGSLSYNEKLAQHRAQSVLEYLQTQLDPSQFVWEVKAFGELNLVTQEQTLEANALNRRALVVFKQGDLPEQ